MSILSEFIDFQSDLKKPKVAVCVPAKDQLHTKFSFCLTQLLLYSQLKGINFQLFFSLGTLIVNQRENLVKDAIEAKCTHILWLDSDMTFPPNTMARLLDHKLPVVAANYATRRNPVKTVAFKKAEDWESYLIHSEDENNTGLVEVDAVGMGCMMVDVSLYHQLARPWHQLIYDIRADDFHGEDMFFCKQLRLSGEKIFIDCELSVAIAHIGDYPYKHHLVTNPPQYI